MAAPRLVPLPQRQGPADQQQVMEDELSSVGSWRSRRPRSKTRDELVGIALSGGGVRSATFNLGVLQALARRNCLRAIDYISSVSGGSYINGWFSAWVSSAGFAHVNNALKGSLSRGSYQGNQHEINHLRMHSSYLTPRTGLLSGDTWTAIAGYFVKLVPNLSAVLIAVSVMLLCPFGLLRTLSTGRLTFIGLGVAVVLLATRSRRSVANDPDEIAQKVALRLSIAAIASVPPLHQIALMGSHHRDIVRIVTFLMAAGWVSGLLWQVDRFVDLRVVTRERLVWAALLSSIAASILVYSTIQGLMWTYDHQTIWVAMGPVILTGIYLAVAVIWILLLELDDSEQERLNRILGNTALYSLLWAVLSVLALLPSSSKNLATHFIQMETALKGQITVGWLLTTIAGLASAFSNKTGAGALPSDAPIPLRTKAKRNRHRRLALEGLARIAPYLFLFGILFCVSLSLYELRDHFGSQDSSLVITFISFLLCTVVLALFIDVNRLSLHNLYRFRLAQCYLCSAANPHDIRLVDVLDTRAKQAMGPYPIINATLNMTQHGDLSVQQRRGRSFVFTPLYSGYDCRDRQAVPELTNAAYQRSEDYASLKKRFTLASAVAISGAAQSPNQGSHSSPSVAFLLTLANIRLGWWIGNPRHKRGWQLQSPPKGIWPLLKDLFGLANDKQEFVYLSDGGHFENLGLYELVRRRCELIIISDVDMDPRYEFGDLINAIGKCEVDFGAKIVIDTDPLLPTSAAHYSRTPFVVGRISYGPSQHRPNVKEGFLLYIKTAVTGSNSSLVRDYDRRNRAFPHEPTANQWFDQDQFEAYRLLGLENTTMLLEAFTQDYAPAWWPASLNWTQERARVCALLGIA